VLLAVLLTTAGQPPAATLTVEGVLLVYGPLGILAGAAVWLGRRLIQSETARADRAEARVAELHADLRALNKDVIDRVVPALVESNRTGVEVLEVIRARR
jgi:hypothetical protein